MGYFGWSMGSFGWSMGSFGWSTGLGSGVVLTFFRGGRCMAGGARCLGIAWGGIAFAVRSTWTSAGREVFVEGRGRW